MRDRALPETEAVTDSRKARPDNPAGPPLDPSPFSPDAAEPRGCRGCRCRGAPRLLPSGATLGQERDLRPAALSSAAKAGGQGQGHGLPRAQGLLEPVTGIPGCCGARDGWVSLRALRCSLTHEHPQRNAPRGERGHGQSWGNEGTWKSYERCGTPFLRACRERTQQKYQQLESQEGCETSRNQTKPDVGQRGVGSAEWGAEPGGGGPTGSRGESGVALGFVREQITSLPPRISG